MSRPAIAAFVPTAPDWRLDWDGLRRAFGWVERLHACPQDPRHHAEGDVGTHTRLVCEALLGLPAFRALPAAERRVAFAAALLHDIAKPDVTVHQPDGRITSHGHSRRGAVDARVLLWREGWSFAERETVARLVAVHQYPFYAMERADPLALVRKLSHEVRLDLLCLLAEADARGRRTAAPKDGQKTLDNVEMVRLLAEEDGCLDQPYPFADDRTRFLYCRDVATDGVARRPAEFPTHGHLDTPGVYDVTVLCGLPGCGKDTWLARNRPGLPVVGFDSARVALGVSHDDDQGAVVQAVQEQARQLLNPKNRRRFVWNATNTNPQLREKCLGLLAAYDARVEIVYLETDEAEMRRRNRARPDRTRVPDEAIDRMLLRWEPPLATECHRIDYVIDGAPSVDPAQWRSAT